MSNTTDKRRRHRNLLLSRTDKVVLSLMLGIPVLVVVGLVWGPALITVALSMTSWDGIGGLSDIKWVGGQNYVDLATIYPPFWPALWHNVLWLLVLFAVFTPLGMLFAVFLDKELRGTRF